MTKGLKKSQLDYSQKIRRNAANSVIQGLALHELHCTVEVQIDRLTVKCNLFRIKFSATNL